MEGKVKFFNEQKGFGFITETGTGKEYFVHATNSLDHLKKDDEVEFDLEEGKKGPKAVNVKRKK
jgi:CspA family cold shock protein